MSSWARIRAITRRTGRSQPPPRPLVVGALELDVRTRRALLRGSELVLTPKEFDLLVSLGGRSGEVVTRKQILSDLWDTAWVGSPKMIDVHIVALRRKLGSRARIETVRGIGFRLRPGEEEDRLDRVRS